MKLITNIFDFIRRGLANGVASLDSTGKVPLSQLPIDPEIYVIVTSLSSVTTPIKNKIYLVPIQNPKNDDNFDEYIYVNNKWEKIGSLSADIDLDDYFNKSEINTELAKKQDKLTAGANITINSSNVISSTGGGPLDINRVIGVVSCTTSANTAVKTVALNGFVRANGSNIIVSFTNANTANNPTLNVNGTGASNIRYNGANITPNMIVADTRYLLVVHNSFWELINPTLPSGSSVTVVDNLNSTSVTNALSANQGKVLNDAKIPKTNEIEGIHFANTESAAQIYSANNPKIVVFYPEL